MTEKDRIKFAIIGAGYIGKRHATLIKENNDSELVAFIDVRTEDECQIDKFNTPLFSSLDEFKSANLEVDVINICTPNGLHAIHCLEALNLDHHVVCEKPMALTKEDCEKVMFTALEKSKHIGTKNDENTVIPISGFEKYSDDSIIYPKLVLWVAEHLYTIGDYNKAMKIITKFWYDSVNSHPLDEWCFDNYPEFMIQSYTVGRWDGARLPLFIKDFSDMVHQDPILTSGMELLQFYNGEIMSSISSSTSNNNIE